MSPRTRLLYRSIEVSGLLLFLILGRLYTRETPLLETPDEPSHFSVIKYIAETRSLPPPPSQQITGPVPTIADGPPAYYAPPLYYVLGAALIQGLDTSGFALSVIPNPTWARDSGPTPGHDPVNKNAYVHTAEQRFPFAGWAVAFHRLRLFSLLLGTVTVIGAYGLACRLWPTPQQRGWAWVATALVAFNATHLFTAEGVTNDALLIPLSTWAFVFMAGLLTGKKSVSLVLELGLAVLVGLAILTKQSAFFLVPIGMVAIFLKGRRQKWPPARLLAVLFAFGFIVTLIGGWWYIYNGLVYGNFLGLFSHIALDNPPSMAARLHFLSGQLWGAFKSYWAAFGWALLFVHPSWYVAFGLLTLGGFLGGLRAPADRTANTWPGGISYVLTAAVLLNVAFLLVWMWNIAAPYGRLLFPVIAPLACLIVEGWRRGLTLRGQRVSILAGIWQVAVIAGLLISATLVPFLYLQPAFAAPIATPAELTRMIPVEADFHPNWRLRGYYLDASAARPGETVEISLYWQLTGVPPSRPDYTVFVQLAPQNPELRIAGVDELLGTPRYPTSAWQVGEVISQRHSLHIPLTAPAPALYWFNVGLYQAESSGLVDQRLPPGIAAQLGPLRVTPASRPLPATAQPVHYDFASTIRLNGYELDWPAGKATLTVDLHWQALAPPPADWHVFIHLLDEAGQLVAQRDGPPRDGDYPTSWWQPGERVIDQHTLILPEAAEPGDYQLKIGLYHWLDGQRLPVTNADNQPLPQSEVTVAIERK